MDSLIRRAFTVLVLLVLVVVVYQAGQIIPRVPRLIVGWVQPFFAAIAVSIPAEYLELCIGGGLPIFVVAALASGVRAFERVRRT